ncbi:MAG: amidohydrolase family protein [Clostridia bacterium]|nr:amidohydrolase family protein [Clostridia bacterium]
MIDFHTHIYPEPIADKATKAVRDFYEFEEGGVHGTAEFLLEQGKKAGVEEFVVLPVALNPKQVRKINQNIIEETALHPELHGFGTVHAAMENMEEELEFIEKNGLLGIKIHPDTQLFNIDDERLFPMYAAIQGKMPIMIHTGDYRYDYSHPRRLVKILEMFPKLEVIGAHFGGWSLFGEAYELLKNRSCWVDLSSSRQFMSEAEFLKYIDLYGADRVLYGSDFPLWDPKEEAEFFLRLPLAEDAREKIAWKNAEKIMKRC